MYRCFVKISIKLSVQQSNYILSPVSCEEKHSGKPEIRKRQREDANGRKQGRCTDEANRGGGGKETERGADEGSRKRMQREYAE